MFGTVRRLSEALEALGGQVAALRSLWEKELVLRASGDSLEERLEALELSRATWEATVEADFLRSEAKYKSARNAEERQRHAERKAAEELAFGDLESQPGGPFPLVPSPDVDGGEGGEVLALHEPLEMDPKDAALRMKFGI